MLLSQSSIGRRRRDHDEPNDDNQQQPQQQADDEDTVLIHDSPSRSSPPPSSSRRRRLGHGSFMMVAIVCVCCTLCVLGFCFVVVPSSRGHPSSSAAAAAATIITKSGGMSMDDTASYAQLSRATSLAAISYCSEPHRLRAWNCSSCLHVNTITIEAILTDQHADDHQRVDAFAFIGIDVLMKQIVVSFRGSTPYQLMFIDPLTHLHQFGSDSGSKIHTGFLMYFRSIEKQLHSHLQRVLGDAAYASYSVLLTGHSLGGAIASVSAVGLEHVWSAHKVRPLVYTIGCPRVGNAAFGALLARLTSRHHRIIRHDDPVIDMPPENGFVDRFATNLFGVQTAAAPPSPASSWSDKYVHAAQAAADATNVSSRLSASSSSLPGAQLMLAHMTYFNTTFLHSCDASPLSSFLPEWSNSDGRLTPNQALVEQAIVMMARSMNVAISDPSVQLTDAYQQFKLKMQQFVPIDEWMHTMQTRIQQYSTAAINQTQTLL